MTIQVKPVETMTTKTQRHFHYDDGVKDANGNLTGNRLHFSLMNNPNDIQMFLKFLKQAQTDVEKYLESTVSGDNQ